MWQWKSKQHLWYLTVGKLHLNAMKPEQKQSRDDLADFLTLMAIHKGIQARNWLLIQFTINHSLVKGVPRMYSLMQNFHAELPQALPVPFSCSNKALCLTTTLVKPHSPPVKGVKIIVDTRKQQNQILVHYKIHQTYQ